MWQLSQHQNILVPGGELMCQKTPFVLLLLQSKRGAGMDQESTGSRTSRRPPARGCSGIVSYLSLAPGLLLDTNQPCNESFFCVYLFSEHQLNVSKILLRQSPEHFKDARGEDRCSAGTLRVSGGQRNPAGLGRQQPNRGIDPRAFSRKGWGPAALRSAGWIAEQHFA